MPSPVPSPPLFPSFVAQHSVTFDPKDPTELERQFPGLALPASLRTAVRKRQAEYLAGRHCAREALRVLAPEHADVSIVTGAQREPIWPHGIVGSITHTHELASVAVARAAEVRSLGLDVERIMPDAKAEDLLDRIATPAEIGSLAETTGWTTGPALTLVFSAKESIYKCLFPEVRRYFDFHDAFVFAIDPVEGRFSARLVTTLTPELRDGLVLEGRFERGADFIFTAVVRV